ncbi:hypothetical protein HZC30_07070 [Candidatus Woesearchaeota archaeon]|nr:hypothetical protein [Candidatus Woesearchaeota archaeon]
MAKKRKDSEGNENGEEWREKIDELRDTDTDAETNDVDSGAGENTNYISDELKGIPTAQRDSYIKHTAHVSEEYDEIKRTVLQQIEDAERSNDPERVAQLREQLDGIKAHQYAAEKEVAAAYSVFPVKKLMRDLKAELEAKYVADEGIEDLSSRVVTYTNRLIGLSIEATTMVENNPDETPKRNSEGRVFTLSGWVDQGALDNARFYLQTEISANQKLFDGINTKLKEDRNYRALVAESFQKFPQQVFVPQHRKDLSEYLGGGMPEETAETEE